MRVRKPTPQEELHMVRRMMISFLVAFAVLAVLAVAAALAQGNPLDRSNKDSHVLTYPIGARVSLPAGWTSRSEAGVTLLVPPDQRNGEAYLLLMSGTQGARRTDDPRVAQALETDISQMAPLLRRDGAAEPLRSVAGTSAAVYGFAGENNGTAYRARTYVVMCEYYSIVLLALGERAAVDARDAELREMIAGTSFDGPGHRDPALVGYWKFSKSSSYTSGQFTAATEYTRELLVNEDGTYASKEGSRAIGGDMNAGFDSGTDPSTMRGVWFASDGMACVVLEGAQGAMALQYRITGEPGSRTLTLMSPNGNQVYYEQR